jgi:hypothetical protein
VVILGSGGLDIGDDGDFLEATLIFERLIVEVIRGGEALLLACCPIEAAVCLFDNRSKTDSDLAGIVVVVMLRYVHL